MIELLGALLWRQLMGMTVLESGVAIQPAYMCMPTGANDDLPTLSGESIGNGSIALAPGTITFLAFPAAGNSACQ